MARCARLLDYEAAEKRLGEQSPAAGEMDQQLSSTMASGSLGGQLASLQAMMRKQPAASTHSSLRRSCSQGLESIKVN